MHRVATDPFSLSQIYTVVAVDEDVGNNSALLYSINSQLPQEHFIINSEW